MGFELINDEERYLCAHVADLQRQSIKTGVPRFSAFLNEREAAAVAHTVNGVPVFYGGYDGAARTVCGFLADTYAEEYSEEDIFPVRAVTFSFRKCDKPSHRDFLGAILGLEIKRELVGDILVAEDHAVVFCHETAEELVLGLTKIGRAGVTAEKGVTKTLPPIQTQTIDTTVSSLRLDCIVSAATNVSRDRSASLIKMGMVNADFSPVLSVSAEVKENTVVSIRGHGRFRLSKVIGETRKGRLRVEILKYV